MLGPADIIRAARLAVARYGAEADRVQIILQSVLAAHARGESADFFDALAAADVLTARQANELRAGLDQTQIDPVSHARAHGNAAPSPRSANGQTLPDALSKLPQLAGYRILRRLGEGGMGSVFLAYDTGARRHVALKVLAPEQAAVQGSLDRFRREASSGRALNHPNIVRNFGAGQDAASGLHFLVLEYVDGPTAHDLLERFGRLQVGDAVHIILDIARALEHAHGSALVHRDIKPANILLTTAGLAKLSDLGLAKRTDDASHLTHARQGVGTPYYMPYEQALNAKAADPRSDLFALGATLYHLLTGEVPFPGDSPMDVMEKKDVGVYLPARSLNPDIPEALETVIARLLARRPDQRYGSASELIVDLERTGLAAAVPSFVDIDLALRDPVVRERLATAAQPTSVDVGAEPTAERVPGQAGFWYLRFKDRHGRPCKAKLTQAQVLQRLREGKLSARVEAARAPQGEYRPLGTYSEFRDATAPRAPRPPAPAPPAPPSVAWTQRVPWLPVMAGTLGVGIIVVLAITAWWLWKGP